MTHIRMTSTHSIDGREWAKLSELKAGDMVHTNGSFSCGISEKYLMVEEDLQGELFVMCDQGRHYLFGQADDGDHLVGIWRMPIAEEGEAGSGAFHEFEYILDGQGRPTCKFRRGATFWFHDETHDEHGPFSSIQEVEFELSRYVHYLETGKMTASYKEDGLLWDAIGFLSQKVLREHIIPNGFEKTPLHTQLLLFISEVIEIFEDERNGVEDSIKIPGFKAVEEEAADIVLRVLSAASTQGWRLGEAMRAKHAYNMTRPYKHGKKF